jgi:hypothetical protein
MMGPETRRVGAMPLVGTAARGTMAVSLPLYGAGWTCWHARGMYPWVLMGGFSTPARARRAVACPGGEWICVPASRT